VKPRTGIGLELFKLRQAQGLTMQQAAYRAGVQYRVWNRLELGEHRPNLATLQQIADGLGADLVVRFEPREEAPWYLHHIYKEKG
jgi:transcriptional regulator with XRE-family HTH domain